MIRYERARGRSGERERTRERCWENCRFKRQGRGERGARALSITEVSGCIERAFSLRGSVQRCARGKRELAETSPFNFPAAISSTSAYICTRARVQFARSLSSPRATRFISSTENRPALSLSLVETREPRLDRLISSRSSNSHSRLSSTGSH